MGRRAKPWFRPDIGWWVTNVGGKQHRLAKAKNKNAAKPKAEAQRAFHELMALTPRRPEAHNSRVCDLAEAFLDFARKQKYSDDTIRNYNFYLMSFCLYAGDRQAREIIPNDVTNWLNSPKEDDTPRVWNDTTEYNAKRYAFRLFSWATEEGLLAKNPLKGLKREKPVTKRRCLTEGEYCSLLRGARRPLRLFLWALMETGARPSELRRLKWNEVKADTFEIEKHKTAKKTGKPRIIYVTARLQRHIAQLKKRFASPYVFVNSLGEPWTGNAVVQQVNRIKQRCHLADDVCVYMIRHTFATWALMRGVDPVTLAEILGHKDMEMIINVYQHLAEQKGHMLNAAELAARRPARPKPAANGRRLSA